ncbi:hypothetical protein HB837_15350 [Listeria innocua]|uniref:hypothetical protein n=1 Tax=Listeria innocua TaxID=1642 RepID=UPI0016278218|nr:hypothetical protein [Listeria innocua]MBC1353786.1 hypothetical protein [Listeria innocua]
MANAIDIQISQTYLEEIIRDEVRSFLSKQHLEMQDNIRGPTKKMEYTRKEFLELIGMSWNRALELFWFNEEFKEFRYKKGDYDKSPWFIKNEGLEWFRKWEEQMWK